MDVHEHRQGFLCLARAEYVHPVTGPAIAHVVRVRREELVLWERICRVVPREKALELLLLLRRLGADHFFQHICRCLSWDFHDVIITETRRTHKRTAGRIAYSGSLMPSSAAISCRASSAVTICSGLCSEMTQKRSRALPRGTAG